MRLDAGPVFLRPLTRRDAPAYLAAVEVSRADLAPWMHWEEQTRTVDDVVAYIRRTQADRRRGSDVAFGIFTAAAGELVGACGVEAISPLHASAEIGYWVRTDRHRQGIAIAASRALLRYGFADLGLHRIHARANVVNRPSLRLLRKLGMKKEGVMRESWCVRGVFSDHALFAILRAEWEASPGR